VPSWCAGSVSSQEVYHPAVIEIEFDTASLAELLCSALMEYPASKTRSLNIAFVVDTDRLKCLVEILGETSDRLEYTVKFSDGTDVRYSEIEEVIRQPNSSERSIVSLIVGPAERTAKSAYVNLKKSVFPSVEYTINGTQRDVIYVADKLDDWVATIRQWYSPIFSWAGPILSLLVLGLPMLVAYRVTLLYPYVSAGKGAALIAVAMIATGAVEVGCLMVLFPRGTFAVGHGEKGHQVITWVRNTVLVGLGLSIIGSVIANWIIRRP
jgi:hypothetical protein